MLVLSETVVILVDHKARDSEVKLHSIQKLGDYARTVILSYLKLILSTFHWKNRNTNETIFVQVC